MSIPPDVVAVVDDDVFVLGGLGRVLSSYGYRVYMFTSAERYLDTADASKASCAVIDIDLRSEMSGLDLGRAISSSGKAIPIIFMTGSADPAIRKQALDMGCVAFLEKPFPSELLITAILQSGASAS
jgi:FixJ family two-component response regulator